MWAVPDGGLDDSLGVNLPAVVLLATSGVGAMIFMFRSIVKFQREMTAVYVDENQKLRQRIEVLEAEIATLKKVAVGVERAQLKYEGEAERRIRDLELLVKNTQATATRVVDRKLNTLLQHDAERDQPGLRYGTDDNEGDTA